MRLLRRFPSLTKRNIRWIFMDDTLEPRNHPVVYYVAGFTRENLVDTLLALKALRQVVLPVYADLQFRLCWKLLPTRSRFWFLQHTSENVLQCGYPDCTSVETEKHLFFDCARVAVLWGIVADDWRLFLPAITWEIACVPLEPTGPCSPISYAPGLKILWTILRSVTLHCVWTARNKHHFENRPPLEARNAIYQVYSTFSSHFGHYSVLLLRESDLVFNGVSITFRLVLGSIVSLQLTHDYSHFDGKCSVLTKMVASMPHPIPAPPTNTATRRSQ